MIRLAIVAPAAVMRAGLEALAASSPNVQLVGAFDDFSALDTLRPDVVVAAALPSALAPPLHGDPPAYVLLMGGAEPRWTQEALRLGVRAILPADAAAGEILAAVEAVANGLAVIAPSELDAMLATAPGQGLSAAASASSTLTTRELEVLRMLGEGAANKTIAWKLGISEHTVKFHVASILGKLGAASRTEAVAIGVRRGLVLL